MGWMGMSRLSMGGHDTPKAYLDAAYTWDKTLEDGSTRGMRVLASSCIQNRIYYAAAHQLTDGVAGPVFAIVAQVRWNPKARNGDEFMYKDADENMGPTDVGCPERILALLSPTDHPYALNWRRRCWFTLLRRNRTITDGMRIRFPEPVRFVDGHEGREFLIEKRGRSLCLRDPDRRSRYRFSHFLESKWVVVRETKVHKTIFA